MFDLIATCALSNGRKENKDFVKLFGTYGRNNFASFFRFIFMKAIADCQSHSLHTVNGDFNEPNRRIEMMNYGLKFVIWKYFLRKTTTTTTHINHFWVTSKLWNFSTENERKFLQLLNVFEWRLWWRTQKQTNVYYPNHFSPLFGLTLFVSNC